MASTDLQRRATVLCTVCAFALAAACGRQNDDAEAANPASAGAPEASAAETVAALDANAAPEAASGADESAPTEADAAAFIEEVETFYREFGEYAARIAWAAPTISSTVSPRTRSARSRPPICEGAAWPAINNPKASDAAASDRGIPSATWAR